MRNAIILAAKRTGSTFLQECLNSHPNITCYDEMFMRSKKGKREKRRGQYLYGYVNATKGFTYKEYINWLFNNEGAISFRLMYPHLENHRELSNVLIANQIPIIHLIRKNYFEHYLSTQTKKDGRVKIDTSTIVQEMRKLKEREEYHRNKFKNNNRYMEIYYEDMIGKVEGKKKNVKNYGAFNLKSKQITYLTDKYTKKICNFMSVDHKNMYCNVTKRNSWNIWDHIQNDNKVRKTVGKSEFSYLIEGK